MGTVTLACTWPNGLILRGHHKIKDDAEQTGRRIEPTGQSVQIPGPGDGERFGKAVVDSSFWDDWIAHHLDLELVNKGILFVLSRDDTAEPPPVNTTLIVGDTRRP